VVESGGKGLARPSCLLPSARRGPSPKRRAKRSKNIQISQEAGDAGARDLHVARETSRVGEGRKEGPRGDQRRRSPLAMVLVFHNHGMYVSLKMEGQMVVGRACIVFKRSRQGNPERGDEGKFLVKAKSSHRSVSGGHIRATP
jgi:hypothetical protein